MNIKWKEDAISHFMTELIDYAGLFPPAALSLTEAITNYHSYIHESDSWMLGPFVIPASRLGELKPFKDQFNEQYPLRLSVILSRLRDIEKDLKDIQFFLETYLTAGTIEAIEVPLPPKVDSAFLEKLENKISDYQIFFELQGSNKQLLSTLDSIQVLNQKSSRYFGVKLRMGGVTTNLFPSSEQVAFIIHECWQRDLPLKFTAGMHHPIRQYREEVRAFMHGFVNVFTASIMAYCRSANKEIVQTILQDEDSTNFSFTADTLSWRNLVVSSSEIYNARCFFVTSYGSCSFDEPRKELGELAIFHEEAIQ